MQKIVAFLHGKMLILRHESEKDIIKGVLAGICISFGGTIYLRVGGVAGAVLFAFGLIAVITSGLNLFTGKSQFVWGARGRYGWLLAMLLLEHRRVSCPCPGDQHACHLRRGRGHSRHPFRLRTAPLRTSFGGMRIHHDSRGPERR